MRTIWRQKPRDRNKFKRACKGDSLMVQFECDICVFQKLKRRPPNQNLAQDKLLLACIRRANLDAFWSRAETTVTSHAQHITEGLELAELVGIEPPFFVPVGPLSASGHCDYGNGRANSSSVEKERKVPHLPLTMGDNPKIQNCVRKSGARRNDS
jgi:hypothetical protein